ncbi:DUF3429 family protein [Simiduia curdlanivorans]|uniref:DUF3429 domain-containing protein n=1 Tax=Simiduia curdlanivorans TaxID=1492769 RepID=A0ABV8V8P8_9GAMM|nr:DUF3429 family protein [Simiduia curdlanivorans]MDN3639384.1 DUF3429 family protein [Simiduia curdlanivorans]
MKTLPRHRPEPTSAELVHLTMVWLGYLGLLPFAAALVLMAFAQQAQLGMLLFSCYSCAIATFLAGSLWQPQVSNIALALASNLVVLLAVGALLLSFVRPVAGLTLLALCFYLSFFAERFAARSPAYVRMRRRLTGTVILCHALAIYWVLQI